MIRGGSAAKMLVIGTEKLSPTVDMEEHAAGGHERAARRRLAGDALRFLRRQRFGAACGVAAAMQIRSQRVPRRRGR